MKYVRARVMSLSLQTVREKGTPPTPYLGDWIFYKDASARLHGTLMFNK